MSRFGCAFVSGALTLVVGGCGEPPQAPATPVAAVTKDAAPARAGDAGAPAPPPAVPDAHETALLHQLHDRWGWQEDKDGQLRVPMPDQGNYERVRYWAFDHFVGFKYGDDYDVMNVVFIQDAPKDAPFDSQTCLRRADKWGYPQLKSFEVKLEPPRFTQSQWQGKHILVESLDGYVDFGLERHRFSAAYAAYPAYPDACLVFGVAVPWRKHEDLAKQVRDRWVKEAIPQIRPMTPTRPTRKD
jgi:hypothetical protein